jgi:argininosuccinate lyase
MTQNQFDKKSEAWSALFSEPMSELVKRYTASVFFDKRLWLADITGSLAHAEMLAAQGIIGAQDYADIQRGMAQIRAEIESGAFEWKLDLEDVHLNIEARLTQLVGDAGKRLHTGRSRNDQVATDVRLWLVAEIDLINGLLTDLQRALVDVAAQNVDVILPGFTHLQVAQPVSFAHHLLAYVEMFSRDAERMADVRRRANRLPLGSAALAGTTYPLDRERVARTLGMVDAQGHPQVCQNSLDGVSDRDFAIEFTAAASLCMVHISRFSEELILWMSQNFGFIKIADRFTTGSSIMPQKKNPDVPELARGKTGRVVGHLMGLITLMKGQPLAYNKDNQEDKEPLFDTVDTLKDTLRIFSRDGRRPAEPRHGPEGRRHHRQPRRHGRRRQEGLRHGHRPGGLPGEKRPALPRRARNGGPCGEGRAEPRLRPVGAAAGGAARLQCVDRERRVRLPEPARQPQRPQHAGRHRARTGAGADSAAPGAAGLRKAPLCALPKRPLVHSGRFSLKEPIPSVNRSLTAIVSGLSESLSIAIYYWHIPSGNTHEHHHRLHQQPLAGRAPASRRTSARRRPEGTGARARAGPHHFAGGPQLGFVLSRRPDAHR